MCANIAPMQSNKLNFMKMSKSCSKHQKDFAIREKLAEILIVQCDLTGKMEA